MAWIELGRLAIATDTTMATVVYTTNSLTRQRLDNLYAAKATLTQVAQDAVEAAIADNTTVISAATDAVNDAAAGLDIVLGTDPRIMVDTLTEDVAFAVRDSNGKASDLAIGPDGHLLPSVISRLALAMGTGGVTDFDSATKSRTDRVICVGDSITQGGSPGSPYPTYLGQLLGTGKTVTNIGESGWTSASVAVQYGGVAVTVGSAATIPTSGSVSLQLGFSPVVGAQHVGTNTANVVIAGVAGSLTLESGVFTPTTYPSSPVSVTAGTQVVVPTAIGHEGEIAVFWSGQNDLAFGQSTIDTAPRDATIAMVAHMSPTIKRFLVVGVTSGYGTSFLSHTQAQNALLAAQFPAQFIDMQAILSDRARLEAALPHNTEQSTLSSTDLSAIASGYIPPVVYGTDSIHPNDWAKHFLVAPAIYDALAERGWL